MSSNIDDYSCKYVLFKAPTIKKYSLKAINSDFLESCKYYDNLAKSYLIITLDHLQKCTCINNDVLHRLKNIVTNKKHASLLSCINKYYYTLKWLDKTVENIINCR